MNIKNFSWKGNFKLKFIKLQKKVAKKQINLKIREQKNM